MRKFVILTDSSADLNAKEVEELNVNVLSLTLTIAGKEYKDLPDRSEITCEKFYNLMRQGEVGKTAAVSIGVFEKFFEEHAKNGEDVLYLGFSSGLSGTYSAGKKAAEIVSERYPERKLIAVDSLCASRGFGFFVYLCAKKADTGCTIEEVRDYAEDLKLHICHAFTVDDLVYLKRGGRVSAATALLGGMLNIKPVMHVDDEGHLIKIGKVRGRKASLDSLLQQCRDRYLPDYEGAKIAFLCHGDCKEEAEQLAKEAQKEFGFEHVYIDHTGPVIGAHSGPGTMAFFFIGGKR